MRLQATYFVDSSTLQRDGLRDVLKGKYEGADIEVRDGSTVCRFDYIVCVVDELEPTTKGGKTLVELLTDIKDTIAAFGHRRPGVEVLVRSTQYQTSVSSAPKEKEEADD